MKCSSDVIDGLESRLRILRFVFGRESQIATNLIMIIYGAGAELASILGFVAESYAAAAGVNVIKAIRLRILLGPGGSSVYFRQI